MDIFKITLINNKMSIYKFLILLFRINPRIKLPEGCQNLNEFIEDFESDFYDKFDNIFNQDHSIRMLKKLLNQFLEKNGAYTILCEDKYVDKYYRSSYYTFYSSKHIPYSRFCKRLLLFKGNQKDSYRERNNLALESNLMASIVIRPLSLFCLGRTLINPKYLVLKGGFIRTTKYDLNVHGMKLQIEAFPYSMQDGETISCSETTIINLVDYFSTSYPEYKQILPEDIEKVLEQNSSERIFPTMGLTGLDISKILKSCGFEPVIHYKDSYTDETFMKRLICYYIESGIPIIIGSLKNDVFKHSVVCMGHGEIDTSKIGWRKYHVGKKETGELWIEDIVDLIDNYIFMDDNQQPYNVMSCKEIISKNLKSEIAFVNDDTILNPKIIIVPLYKRMILDASSAYECCTSFLSNENLGIKADKNLRGYGEINNPFIIRLLMASSKGFKKGILDNIDEEIKNTNKSLEEKKYNTLVRLRKLYAGLLLPKFVWICEVYTTKSLEKIKGLLVIDATAYAKSMFTPVLLAHYPKYILINNSDPDISFYDNSNLFEKMELETEINFSGYNRNLDFFGE